MKILQATPFTFGSLPWQVRPGRESMVAVVKATYAIVPDGVCTLADEPVPVTGEIPFDDEEDASPRTDTDLAVFKPRGECFLAGTCHPPGGKPVLVSAVSFRIGSVAKQLAVFGDRAWNRSLASGGLSQPEPFTSMPLRYERSFGGPGFDKNPLGRGIGTVETASGPRRLLPNLEDPRALVSSPDARPNPAGAFPIPRGWKSRMARTGTYDDRWFKTRWPYLPDDFDWAYFNAAPADQQIDGYWRGDEEIQLQNLHPQRAMIRTRLPGLVARCFAEVRAGDGFDFRELQLKLDTITVDADAMQVLCVWRGLTDVASPKLEDVARVFVLHEPVGDHATQAECRAWMERVHAAEDEDGAAPESPLADEPTDFAFDIVTESDERTVVVEIPAEAPPANDVLAQLAAAGVVMEPDAPPPPPPTVEHIEALKQMLRDVGEAVPPDFDALLPPPAPTTKPPPAPEPVRATLRERVMAHVARGEALTGMDLTEADLSGLDLRGARFDKAILAGASLGDARFDGANLDGAVLARADLTRAVFYGASLRGADLTGAHGAQVQFDTAVLDGAVMDDAAFPRSAFRRASMKKTELQRVQLPGCAMEEAVLDEADLTEALLEDTVFTGARLVDATLDGVRASRVRMDGCDLTKLRAGERAVFSEAVFRGATAPGSRWIGAKLDKADFTHANLARADFGKTLLVQTLLNGCNLKEAKFADAVMVGVSMLRSDAFAGLFEGADLSHADLRGSNFFGAEFWNAKTEAVRLELTNLKRTKLEGRR